MLFNSVDLFEIFELFKVIIKSELIHKVVTKYSVSSGIPKGDLFKHTVIHRRKVLRLVYLNIIEYRPVVFIISNEIFITQSLFQIILVGHVCKRRCHSLKYFHLIISFCFLFVCYVFNLGKLIDFSKSIIRTPVFFAFLV